MDKIFRKENTIFLQIGAGIRTVGTLKEEKKVLETHRVYSRHLHRISNSFGFCHELLSRATKFDTVEITTDRNELFAVPVEVLLKEGKFLYFKQQGFEKQIFVTLDVLREYDKTPAI